MSKTEDNIAWSNQKLYIRWRRITRRRCVAPSGRSAAARGLIRLQRIYNFLLLHAILSTVLDIIGLYYPLLYYFWD